LHIGIGIRRGQTMHRKLHVDTLILISTFKIYVFLYSRRTDERTDRDINPVGLSSLRSSRLIPTYNSHAIQTLYYCVSLSCIVWIHNLTITIFSQKYQELSVQLEIGG
jgi:hypothetical protein